MIKLIETAFFDICSLYLDTSILEIWMKLGRCAFKGCTQYIRRNKPDSADEGWFLSVFIDWTA